MIIARWRFLIPIGMLVGLSLAWSSIARRTDDSLVVYCTHDLIYAEPVFEEFTRQTGIQVTVVSDIEATKSLGLIERLLREGAQSPCDLLWNNEVLGTIRLQRKRLLLPYQGPATQRFPAQFRDATDQWCGFAGRMRVWVERRETRDERREPARPDAAPQSTNDHGRMTNDFLAPANLSRVAIAKPLYGTTFTQYAMLWKLHGPETTQAEHQSLVDRHCRFVAGNAMVRDMVAGGSCDRGMTDTDDVFAALDAGQDVVMEPVRIDGQTLCIPNTVALLKSSDRPMEARQLFEYLLSEEVELQLAKTARQIPLGTMAADKIPDEVRPLVAWAIESWNVADAADVAEACLEWLKSEYAR